jgi:hypothetical protein
MQPTKDISMHRLALGTYHFSSRAQGSYMMLLVVISIGGLPIFDPAQLLGPSLLITVLGLGVALLLCRPQWQPDFLRTPSGFRKGMAAMFCANIIFLVGVFLGFTAILNLGLPEPLSRSVSMLLALPTVVLTGLMWITAVLLISSKPAGGAPKPNHTVAPEQPPEPVASPRDLRQLRLSRTS